MHTSQISASISDETREPLKRYVRARGVKKGFVIEQALLHHLQAFSELPEEVVVVSHHLPFCPSREQARRRYRGFVHEGVGETIWQGLRRQIHLGDEAFVTRMQRNAQIRGDSLSVPRAQRGARAGAADGGQCPPEGSR
jgi:hypothetical protein